MPSRSRSLSGFLAGLFFVFLGGGCDLYERAVLGHVEHDVPCDRLPSAEEVARVLEEHATTVDEIKAVNPQVIEVYFDKTRCPVGADVVIEYGTTSDLRAIQELVGARFFGVPYRMYNR